MNSTATADAATEVAPEAPKPKTVWLAGGDVLPDLGIPVRDDLGRTWAPREADSEIYTFDGRHFEKLSDLHARHDLFRAA
jgi:hypothetical protein